MVRGLQYSQTNSETAYFDFYTLWIFTPQYLPVLPCIPSVSGTKSGSIPPNFTPVRVIACGLLLHSYYG